MADSDDDWESAAPIQIQNAKKPTTAALVEVDDEPEEVSFEEAGVEASKPKREVDAREGVRPKAASRQKQKEREEELAREAERARSAKPMTAEEKAAEALRLRRLQEDEEVELAREMYGSAGASASGAGSAAAGMAAKLRDGVQDLDMLQTILQPVQVTTNKQAQELAKAVTKKLELDVSKKDSVAFVKELLRGATASLSEEEVSDLINVLNVIKNEKVKAKADKKKPAAAKAAPLPKLNSYGLEKPGGDRYDMDDIDNFRPGKKGGGGRAFDDGDFM